MTITQVLRVFMSLCARDYGCDNLFVCYSLQWM